MIRWSLGEALRGWGFEPVEAETVSAALAEFEAEPPAAVLLDINLPDGSGLDVLRKIRQRQQDAVVILCHQMHVSRTSVREARCAASEPRRLVTIAQQGPSVSTISWDEAEQIYDAASALPGRRGGGPVRRARDQSGASSMRMRASRSTRLRAPSPGTIRWGACGRRAASTT